MWQPWAHSRLLLAYFKCLTIIFGYTDEKPLPKLLVCVCFFICILWTPPSPLWLCWREMTHYGEQREDSSRRYVTRQKNHCKSKSNFLSTRTGTQLHLIIGEGAVHLFHCYLSYSYTTLTFCLWDWNSNRKDIRARNVEIQYPRINFVLHYEA